MESVSGAVSCWIRMPRGETDDRETGRRRSFPLARAVDEDKEMDEDNSDGYEGRSQHQTRASSTHAKRRAGDVQLLVVARQEHAVLQCCWARPTT
jgi:valyl-tRNA synthetase